jgi:hypothetical protein
VTIEAESSVLTPNLRSFLTDQVRHTTIATVNPDGSPHQIVIWFLVRGDELVVNSRHGRRWPSNLRRERRANVCIYEGDNAVTLDVELIDSYEGEPAQADIAEMARRYYTPETAERDIARFQTQERVSFVLRPTRAHVHGDPR